MKHKIDKLSSNDLPGCTSTSSKTIQTFTSTRHVRTVQRTTNSRSACLPYLGDEHRPNHSSGHSNSNERLKGANPTLRNTCPDLSRGRRVPAVARNPTTRFAKQRIRQPLANMPLSLLPRPLGQRAKGKSRVEAILLRRLRRRSRRSVCHSLEEAVVASSERLRRRRRTGAFVLRTGVLAVQDGELVDEGLATALQVSEAVDDGARLGLATAEGRAELRYHLAAAVARGYGGGVVGD